MTRPVPGRVVPSCARLLALVAAIVLVLAGASPARAAKPTLGESLRAARALHDGRMDEARELVGALVARAPQDPEVRYLGAYLAFLDGEYARAVTELAAIRHDPRTKGSVAELLPLVESTEQATRGFARRELPHFVIVYPPGRDEILVELAGEALEAAYERIGDDLGYRPKDRIRVEILPRSADLARVSPLTEKEIETSGTIALAKYNKLMVVSPRATLFGYPWMDTLAHEYVHLVVSRLSGDRVPVWLQEGLAKFEETRWRAEPGAERLPRFQEGLLAQALKRGKLITFEQMHPSMAKLPSQEAAATAFAQVFHFVGWLHAQKGYAGLRDVLTRIESGRSEKRAIAEVMGKPFEAVVVDWKRHMKRLPLRGPAGGKLGGKIRFAKGDKIDENVGIDLVAEKARKHARLGGMLRTRRRLVAAAAEYEKALALAGPDDLFVAGKLARTYLDLERYDRAIAVAEPLVARSEDDAYPLATLGAAYLGKGDLARAEVPLARSLQISPFDPAVRCGLAKIYQAQGKSALAARETAACDELGGGQAGPGPAGPASDRIEAWEKARGAVRDGDPARP